MNQLYALNGISKQTHWEWGKRQETLLDNWLLLEPIILEWRERHPSMSLKKLYHIIAPNFIGRDKFIDYGMLNDFEALRYSKRPKSTTYSPKENYPNLLLGLNILNINQVWVSDTTYFKIKNKWVYITFIMDLYSRYIVGYHAATSLFAQANLEALLMATRLRNIKALKTPLIHHSDRGSQYKSLLYTQALKNAKINISMGKIVYDNIHIERFHQTIKGEYLIHKNIQSIHDLRKQLPKVIELYNHERPHQSLGMKTPYEFENYLCNVPLCQRTNMNVFALDTKSKKQKQSKKDPNQLLLSL